MAITRKCSIIILHTRRAGDVRRRKLRYGATSIPILVREIEETRASCRFRSNNNFRNCLLLWQMNRISRLDRMDGTMRKGNRDLSSILADQFRSRIFLGIPNCEQVSIILFPFLFCTSTTVDYF